MRKLNLKITHGMNRTITRAAAQRTLELGRHVSRSDIVRWSISKRMKRPAVELCHERGRTPALTRHFMLSALVPVAHLRMLDHAAKVREAGSGIVTTRSWVARRAIAVYLGLDE